MALLTAVTIAQRGGGMVTLVTSTAGRVMVSVGAAHRLGGHQN
jgi:hypothetical protein